MNCPECGHPNADWRSNCEKCGRTLAEFRSDLTALPTKRTKCWHCGYENTAAQGSVCMNCGVSLKQPGSRSHVPQRTPPHPEAPAPSKIQTYALFFIIAAGISGFASFSLSSENRLLFILLLVLAIMQGIAAAGMWHGEKWGGQSVVILVGLSILLSLLSDPLHNRGVMLGIVFNGAVLFRFFRDWFIHGGNLSGN